MSTLICSQRGRHGPYRLPPKQLVPWLNLGRSRYRNPFVIANERANQGILRFRPLRLLCRIEEMIVWKTINIY